MNYDWSRIHYNAVICCDREHNICRVWWHGLVRRRRLHDELENHIFFFQMLRSRLVYWPADSVCLRCECDVDCLVLWLWLWYAAADTYRLHADISIMAITYGYRTWFIQIVIMFMRLWVCWNGKPVTHPPPVYHHKPPTPTPAAKSIIELVNLVIITRFAFDSGLMLKNQSPWALPFPSSFHFINSQSHHYYPFHH